jgi:putative hemolysin
MNRLFSTLAYAALSVSLAPVAMAGVGLPNPASQLCVELGGTLKPYVQEDGGAVSLCVFQDDVYLNGLIEEWTLFRYKKGDAAQSLAVKAYFDHVAYQAPTQGPVGHPALRYCEQVGGTRLIITEASGDQSGVCRFEDGSQLEEWTLFRGPEVHKSLTKVLENGDQTRP